MSIELKSGWVDFALEHMCAISPFIAFSAAFPPVTLPIAAVATATTLCVSAGAQYKRYAEVCNCLNKYL